MASKTSLLVFLGSFALTGCVIGNAYLIKKQFYPSVVYITKSSPSMAVLYLQALIFVLLLGKVFRKVFFGQLRTAEVEHLVERSWYAVTETCLAFTVFRDDFNPRFVAMFTMLLFIKVFHWLAEDRVDYMERSPLISWLFHARMISLVAVLGYIDCYFLNRAYLTTITKGASVQLVFGFEYAILLVVALCVLVRYVLHCYDLTSEHPWEDKAVYMLYSDLLLGGLKVLLYTSFICIMAKVHTFPLFAIRPMYLSIRFFKKSVNDVILSRRAIYNMNTLFADATEEELAAGDAMCIICREEMTAAGCKKLPCSHIFHSACLRSWFQRQQTCPTCRHDILRVQQQRARDTPAAADQQQQGPNAQHQPNNMPNPWHNIMQHGNMFGGLPGMFPPPPGAQPQPDQAGGAQQGAAGAQAAPDPAQAPHTPQPGLGAWPGFPPPPTAGAPFTPLPFMPPPFMPPSFAQPFPSPPGDLSGLSDEELTAMEGHTRASVEARVKCLQDVQTLLDAAMVQMQQYVSLMSALPPPPPVHPPSSAGQPSRAAAHTSQPQASTSEAECEPATAADSAARDPPLTPVQETEQPDPEGAVGYTPPETLQSVVDDATRGEGGTRGDAEWREVRRRRLDQLDHLRNTDQDGREDGEAQ